MKIKIALACLAGFLVFSSVAAAHQLAYPQARKFAKAWVQEACDNAGPSCLTWQVTKCGRINAHRVDCAATTSYRDGESCEFIVENRLNSDNFVNQRRRNTKCS